ncbi:exodeoxyribonuclease V beta subunit [Candidatus Magnetomoraceae bacterium gMMP-1]
MKYTYIVKSFDLINSKLDGTNLIEASAGTGKTYTLTGLFLRLILEKGLKVNNILVVTFTEAATEELRDRTRKVLRDALRAFSNQLEKTHQSYNFLHAMVKKSKNKGNDPKIISEHLQLALNCFDEAPIFTIHGFCKRMLHENAFESSSLFDTELITDQASILQEIVDDFWRKNFYNASVPFIGYALENNYTPDIFLNLFSQNIAKPFLKIIPEKIDISDTYKQEEEEVKKTYDAVNNLWACSSREIQDLLMNYEGLNRNQYRHSSIPKWIKEMDNFMHSNGMNVKPFDNFKKFCKSSLKSSLKKNYNPPEHLFFDLCEDLAQKSKNLCKTFDNILLKLQLDLFSYGSKELAKKKQKKNVQSFDDLLINLHQALFGVGGNALARTIKKKYKAALIDEFQDTDPIQYDIFNKIYQGTQNSLFLIGDPKQAIYSFRGADIFAYLNAAKQAKSKYTLKTNWRSGPSLITAVNTLFAHHNNAFLFNKISFTPVGPPDKDEVKLYIEGDSNAPFQMWFMPRPEDKQDKPINKGQANEKIPPAVAYEIARLLSLGAQHKACIGDKPISPKDIAVLVRTHWQARLIQEALRKVNIPGVLYSTDSVFNTSELVEIERILWAIAEYKRDSYIKSALITDIMGFNGDKLNEILQQEDLWEECIDKFREYNQIWNKYGFIRMFRYFMLKEKCRARILQLPDGERSLTNILHLSEILHHASLENQLGIMGLLKWLSKKKADPSASQQEHQIRLETDENAVTIITIHKSKGLEYPVVFCPFAWEGSKIKNMPIKPGLNFTFHDKDTNRLVLPLSRKEIKANRAIAVKEELAENLRLLYVALTRAKQRCYLVWGAFKNFDTSSMAWLFHSPSDLSEIDDNLINNFSKKIKAMNDNALFADLKHIAQKAEQSIDLKIIPNDNYYKYKISAELNQELYCREFSGKISDEWKITSFSSLTSGKHERFEMPDRDKVTILSDNSVETHARASLLGNAKSLHSIEIHEDSILAFPKGAKAGICLHEIFEHLDFTEKNEDLIKSFIKDKLKVHSYEDKWLAAVYKMVQNVLNTPLDAKSPDFTLSCIKNKDRINEMEFYFPLKKITPQILKQSFEKYSNSINCFYENLDSLSFNKVHGLIKGFIDMVFCFNGKYYLIDWKSNFLGPEVKDYNQLNIKFAMEKELYILQYHIYAMALHKYLILRVPNYNYNNHFGGVYYIFLRGVDKSYGPEFGIYNDLPKQKIINGLCNELSKEDRNVNTKTNWI